MKRLLPWVLVAVAAAAASARASAGADLVFFAHAGRTLHPFASKDVQAGPLEVYGLSLLDRAHALHVLPVLVAVAVLACARSLGVRGLVLAATGVVAVALGVASDAYTWGHPAQVLVPLLWLAAAACVRRGRIEVAGLIVGLSAGFELWGVLGVAALALAPRWRDVARATTVEALTVVALFLPFVRDFHMFDYRWVVGTSTLASHVIAAGTPFPWPARLAQAAVAVAAGVGVARALRFRAEALWVVPLVVSLVRLALDPVNNAWYWDAPTTLALVGGALFATSRQELGDRLDRLALLGGRVGRGRPEVDERDEAFVLR